MKELPSSAFEKAGEEPNFLGVCPAVSSYAVLSRACVLGSVSEGRLLVAVSHGVLILAEDNSTCFVGCAENYRIIHKSLNPGWCSVKGATGKQLRQSHCCHSGSFPLPPNPRRAGMQEAPSSVTGPKDLLTAQRGQPGRG